MTATGSVVAACAGGADAAARVAGATEAGVGGVPAPGPAGQNRHATTATTAAAATPATPHHPRPGEGAGRGPRTGGAVRRTVGAVTVTPPAEIVGAGPGALGGCSSIQVSSSGTAVVAAAGPVIGIAVVSSEGAAVAAVGERGTTGSAPEVPVTPEAARASRSASASSRTDW